MARPPQYAHGDDDASPNVAVVKAMVKRLGPQERAHLMAWLALYFDDRGELFSPQISRRRQRIALNGAEYWLVRVPKKQQCR